MTPSSAFHWIGESTGLQFKFEITNSADHGYKTIDVFTTRPDTLFGASFVAVAADHPLVKKLEQDNPKITSFKKECRSKGYNFGRNRKSGENWF